MPVTTPEFAGPVPVKFWTDQPDSSKAGLKPGSGAITLKGTPSGSGPNAMYFSMIGVPDGVSSGSVTV